MKNDEVTSMPQSPWKKPKIVSLSKSKSIKRKPDLFSSASSTSGLNLNNTFAGERDVAENDPVEFSSQPFPKQRKTFLNRFSVRNSNNLSLHENSLSNGSEDSPNEVISNTLKLT